MHVMPDYVLFGMQLNQCQTVFENSQVVRVQENSSSLEAGRQARQIAVIVQDDLVNSVRPGENVIVTGKCRCICCGAGAYTRLSLWERSALDSAPTPASNAVTTVSVFQHVLLFHNVQ